MSGSQEIELCFLDPLPKEYECPVCRQILRYPVQFDECGHHVCSGCLPEVLRKSSKCPLDDVKVDREKVYVDKPLQRSIQSLGVKCAFYEQGCTWQSQLLDLQNHISECEYTLGQCPRDCGVLMQRRFKEDHLRDDCKKRFLDCEYCAKQLRHEQLIDHWNVCMKYPLSCPNQCGKEGVRREDLVTHMSTECTKAGSACPFVEFGCLYKGERMTIQKHIKDEPVRHLSMLCDAMIELKNLLQNAQLQSERNTIRMDDLIARADSLEKLYGAQMLWKIDNYKQKFNEAKSGSKTTLFSPPFLTGRQGYKMALSACLYGDGKARGQYMSLYICICRGEYDALLSWPFSHRITFTLFDQCQDPAARKNITYALKPNTCKENRPFLSRPIGDRNASFGTQKFSHLHALQTMDYVRDDTMFIKVHVSTEDMPTL